MEGFVAGLVAVVGRPNVGKSSIVNAILGRKISIVSDKPQTTRRRVLGILTTPEFQLVLADTPGIHAPQHKLGAILNTTAYRSTDDVDAILAVVDVSHYPTKADKDIARNLAERPGETPVILAMNKVDLLKAADVQAKFESHTELFNPVAHVMTSVTKGHNLDILVGMLIERLTPGPPLFPVGQSTDQDERTWCEEVVRESVLLRTRQEVPHAVAANVETWESSPRLLKIGMTILVETSGQKAIVIGKGGAVLKAVGTEAREEIERTFGKKVFLELFVRVQPDWRQNQRVLSELGLL